MEKVIFEEAIKNSRCKSDVARLLNLSLRNGNTWVLINKYIKKFGISTDHFITPQQVTNLALYGKQGLKWERITKICPVCGNEFITQKGHSREQTVCSRGCSNTYFRTGSRNGNYKDGYDGQPIYRVVCFKYWDKQCAICGWDKNVDVHHIDGNHTNNEKLNLIPLCPNHHRMTITLKYKTEIDLLIRQKMQDKFDI